MAYDDPADPNYTVIAQPVVHTLPQQPFTTAQGYTQAEADALNALLPNFQQQRALMEAMYIAENRATGARDAGAIAWQTRQVQALQGYAGRLGPLMQAAPELLANLGTALQADSQY